MSSVVLSRRWFAALSLVVAACSGGSDSPTPPAPTPAIGLSVGTPSLTVTPGGTAGTVTVTVTRTGGYAGTVDLTLEGAPAGVTGTLAPASLGASTSSSVLTVTAAGTAAAGTGTLTVRARGTGVTEQTAPIALTVSAPPPTPAYTLTLSPASVSVAQGASGTVRAAFARSGGFTGGVTLTVDGLPAGVTASAAPAAATGDSSVVTLAVAATAAPGTYPLTVRGAASGLAERTASLQLTVTAAQPAGSYAIALTPATLSVAAGASGTSTLGITRSGGFAGAVGIATSGAPTGLTVTPASTSVTGNSVALTVAAAASLAPGSYPVTVRTTATGLADQTATLTVTVTAAAPQGSFTLGVSPATISLTQGGTTTATVTVTRAGGFTGAVDVTVGTLPAGVTAEVVPAASAVASARRSARVAGSVGASRDGVGAFGPRPAMVPVTTGSATIRLTAAATASPGAFTLTVSGSASGLPTQTATASATVTAAPTGGNSVWQFCGFASRIPVFFAYQDGTTGAWTRVQPDAASTATNASFRFTLTQSKGAVAYVVPTGPNGYLFFTYYATRDELTVYGSGGCTSGTRQASGSVAGLGAGQTAVVSLGGQTRALAAGTSAFTIDSLADGALDLLAARTQSQVVGTGVSVSVDRLILRRGVSAGALGTLDFGGAEAFAPAQARVTVNGLAGGETLTIGAGFQTNTLLNPAALGAGGTSGQLYTESLPASGYTGPRPFFGVPTDRLGANDLHTLTVGAIGISSTFTEQTLRIILRSFRQVADQTITLGPTLSASSVTEISGAPYRRHRATLAYQAEYGQQAQLTLSQVSGSTTSRQANVIVSSGYTGGGAWTITVPDLSGVAGWNNSYAIQAGSVNTTVVAVGYDGALGTSLDNRTFRIGGRNTLGSLGIPGFPLRAWPPVVLPRRAGPLSLGALR